ncbi:MAG: hypothetical protein Q9180_008469, partial [Flavoplaca navasiana]
SGLNNMDPSSTISIETEPRDSNTRPSSRKNRPSSIPQILIHSPPESKRQPYNPFLDLSPKPEKNYSPRRPRHQYYDPHYLSTFQTIRGRGAMWDESKDEEKERAARVRWWMDRRDEMGRHLRELEVEEWEERKKEDKERREKEEKEKQRKRISEGREEEQRIAGGAKRREGRDYKLACKRLGEMFSNSRRIDA